MLANIHHQERPRLDPFSSVVEASEHPHKAPNHAHWVQPDDQQRLLHTSEWLLATDRKGPCRHLRRHHGRAPACGRPDHQDRPAGAYWQHAPTAMRPQCLPDLTWQWQSRKSALILAAVCSTAEKLQAGCVAGTMLKGRRVRLQHACCPSRQRMMLM